MNEFNKYWQIIMLIGLNKACVGPYETKMKEFEIQTKWKAPAFKALHHRYQNRELRARESTFIEVNMQLTDAYLVLNW